MRVLSFLFLLTILGPHFEGSWGIEGSIFVRLRAQIFFVLHRLFNKNMGSRGSKTVFVRNILQNSIVPPNWNSDDVSLIFNATPMFLGPFS